MIYKCLHVDVCWSDTGYGSRTILKTDKENVALGGHHNPSYCGAAYIAIRRWQTLNTREAIQ